MANYKPHPMGYCCVDCNASAQIGKAVRHTSRCDIAPRQGVFPMWPTNEQRIALDQAMSTGDPTAQRDAEILQGLAPWPSGPNRVTVCAKPRSGPYIIQSWEGDRWMQCPGQWVSLADAKTQAGSMRGLFRPSREFRIMSVYDLDRPRRLSEFAMRLKQHELNTRGIIRLGDTLRGATDCELDALWEPKSRIQRRQIRAAVPLRPRIQSPAVGLLRTLKLEFVGHDVWQAAKVPKMRPWVARVRFELSDWVGADGCRAANVTDREFERGEFDYEDADKTGGRGVMLVFTLSQGVAYEVYDRARRVGPRRVFMVHDGQCWHDISAREAWAAQTPA